MTRHVTMINEITKEMHRFADEDVHVVGRDVLRRSIQHFADDINHSYNEFRNEVFEVLDNLMDGMCEYCDMQTLCAEGEDGMPTRCNGLLRAKQFVERYKENSIIKNENDECPF